MASENPPKRIRPLIVALVCGVLWGAMLWLCPSRTNAALLVLIVLFVSFVSTLPVCLLILVGRTPQPQTLSRWQATVPFLLAGSALALAIGILWAQTRGIHFQVFTYAGGALGAVLFVTVPLCALILAGYPPSLSLAPLLPSAQERARWRDMRQRPHLSDEEFLQRYYAGSDLPRDIVLRLRKLYSRDLGMDRVAPQDVALEFNDELDLADLALEIQSEFGVSFSDQEIAELAGSFDEVAHAVVFKLNSSRPQ